MLSLAFSDNGCRCLNNARRLGSDGSWRQEGKKLTCGHSDRYYKEQVAGYPWPKAYAHGGIFCDVWDACRNYEEAERRTFDLASDLDCFGKYNTSSTTR
jgi:hypothetical protein